MNREQLNSTLFIFCKHFLNILGMFELSRTALSCQCLSQAWAGESRNLSNRFGKIGNYSSLAVL